jgi:hypothetical protein
MNLHHPLNFTEELVQQHRKEERGTTLILQLTIVLIEEERYFFIRQMLANPMLIIPVPRHTRSGQGHAYRRDFNPDGTVSV